jgi:hypothetical protein
MPTDLQGLPVGGASVSGADVTVSYLLNNPRILEQRIAEAANIDYWADQVLPNIGGAPGGVIGYQEWRPDFNFSTRKPEELGADDEVPLTGSVVGDLKMVAAVPQGLGYVVTDLMRDRNQAWLMNRNERAFANTLADHFNQRAVDLILAAISTNSRYYRAFDWSLIVTDGSTPTPRANWPHSQMALLAAGLVTSRIPFGYDVMLAHALDVWRLCVIYNTDDLAVIASRLGLRVIVRDTTGRVPHGQPILSTGAGAGGTAWENPLRAEVVPERRKRRTVVQAVGSPVYFVDNPYGLLQLRGVADRDIADGVA